jgi:hypothetical protein
VLPPLLIDSEGLSRADQARSENGVRSAGAQFLGGLVLALGLFFTARTLQVNREGQITERFSKAIEQLGDSKLDIRLGGIYALERIARDSKRDHGPVMEVLTAYVRRYKRTSRDRPGRAPYDVQAVATVVGRRNLKHESDESPSLDIRGANLSYVQLYKANLDGLFMQEVDLRNAVVSSSTLRGAFLQDTKLDNAHLLSVDFSNAVLDGAKLAGAYFHDGCVFTGAEYDNKTTWPQGVDPEELGATRTREPILAEAEELG